MNGWIDDRNKEQDIAMSNEDACVCWFKRATGREPYPFQVCFADGDWLRYAVPVSEHHPDDDLFIVGAAMAKRRFEPVSDREERRS